MAATNQWDTDPYGDPTATSPWLGGAAATPPDPSTAPVTAAPPLGDVSSDTSPWSSAQTSAAPAAPAAAPADTYDAHLTNISQATNPASQATATDGLARQLQSDLEADGHTVKWTTPTAMTVDGRPYEVASGGRAVASGGTEGITDPPFPGGDTSGYPGRSPLYDVVADMYRTATGREASDKEINDTITGGSGDLATIHAGIFNSAEAKAYAARPAAGATGAPAPTGGRMDDTAILAQIAQWAQMPGADPSLAADPQYWLNAIKSRDGLGPDNLQYWQDASVGPNAFFRNPGRESGGAGGGSGGSGGSGTGGAGLTSPWLTAPPAGHATPTYPAWSPSAPDYTPGSIDASASELPGYKDIMDALNAPVAGDAELQKLVQSIVEHPETLTDQDIAQLKAKSAEEAAIAGQSADEELKHYGYNTGLDSSPWLAGQRAQNAWNRSGSTIAANRNIDLAAADRRQADRQQAANIGQAYSSFQSSKKAQAVGLAVNAALGKAGEQRSRTQLNESLKQAATQLGLTKDNLVMTYLGHVMTDLTNNRQIDVNFDVDMRKLAEQSDEFKQTLLQRMHELTQADDQFRANYGLAVQEFQQKKNTDAWDRAKSAVG